MRKSVRRVLGPLLLLATILHLWGIRKDLPFAPQVDEHIFVFAAARMAATGDPNPHWFGNPGSTVIYPLAAIFHGWHALAHGGKLLRPDLNLLAAFKSHGHEFYFLGRLLCIAYGILCVPLLYAVGRRAFGVKSGLYAALFFTLLPVPLTHAQTVRTDSAAAFFGLLAIWLALRALERPSLRRVVYAGGAIGLAIASRYFMVALAPPFGLALLGVRAAGGRKGAGWPCLLSGVLAVPLGFALSTPFFFADLRQTVADALACSPPELPGADGLSPWGNLCYYLTQAFPRTLTPPLALLALVGFVRAAWRPHPERRFLGLFGILFLAGLCLCSLHWERWLIQVLPLGALYGAWALRGAGSLLRARGLAQLQLPLLLAVLAWPLQQTVFQNIRQSRASTRIEAREWILGHLPEGAQLAQEWYTAPLDGCSYKVDLRFSLAEGKEASQYRRLGYRYLLTSSDVYSRYYADPLRYAREIAFYEGLSRSGQVLQVFSPSLLRGGPTIHLYDLGPRR